MNKLFSNKKIKSMFSIICRYPNDSIVYNELDKCEQIGYIIKGKLELVHYTIEGEERHLASLKAGDIFGDFLINSKKPFFPGDLIARETTEISFLDKGNLEKLLIKNTFFRNYYLSQLSEKALNLNAHNKVLIQPSLEEKILMWLDQRIDKHNKSLVKINSKENLANYLNVTRPSLSRKLSELKVRGIIEYGKDYIKKI